jgi:tetratricopeptide (TPR) repeat protein
LYYCLRVESNNLRARAFLVLLLCVVCKQHASLAISPTLRGPSKDAELIETWQQLARECRKHLARQEYDDANACAKSLVALAKTLPKEIRQVLIIKVEAVGRIASDIDRVCHFAEADRSRFATAAELQRGAWEAGRKQDFAEMLHFALRSRRAFGEVLGNASVFAENMTLDVIVAAIELDMKSVDIVAIVREFTEHCRQTYGELSPLYGQSLIIESRIRRLNGELDAADRLIHTGLGVCRRSMRVESEAYALLLGDLAELHLRRGQAAAAEVIVRQIYRAGAESFEAETSGWMRGLMGRTLVDLGEYDDANTALKLAVEDFADAGLTRTRCIAGILDARAVALQKLKKLDEAVECAGEAKAIRLQLAKQAARVKELLEKDAMELKK